MSGEHLQSAIAHYEAALKASWPDGAKGAVFDEWNAARKAIPEVGPEWLCSQSQHEAGKRHVAAMLAASPQAAPASPQQAPAPQQALTQAQRIRLWNNSPEYHGDVVGRDAFERLVKLVESVHRIGEPAPQLKALTDEQRIDWLCEEAEFTCGQWQVVIDSDKESFLDAIDEMARTAHDITQPSQQEQTK